MKKNPNLPMHVQFFLPILTALRQLGGSASTSELKDTLVSILDISEEELEERFKSGISRVDNLIQWSKIYLVRDGLLDVTNPAVWALTEEGLSRDITEADILQTFRRIHGGFAAAARHKEHAIQHEEGESSEEAPHRAKLLEILKSLSPEGFERLCQRLLRSSGFTRVIVRGRSGDGGIDGEGILEINPIVSVKVIFQAKRYKDAVPSFQVRDFRGALQGRAEKGIFITTGRFTNDAKAEAIREGAPPIDLVDGEKLVQLFEKSELGLKRRTVYDIDDSFFDDYR